MFLIGEIRRAIILTVDKGGGNSDNPNVA